MSAFYLKVQLYAGLPYQAKMTFQKKGAETWHRFGRAFRWSSKLQCTKSTAPFHSSNVQCIVIYEHPSNNKKLDPMPFQLTIEYRSCYGSDGYLDRQNKEEDFSKCPLVAHLAVDFKWIPFLACKRAQLRKGLYTCCSSLSTKSGHQHFLCQLFVKNKMICYWPLTSPCTLLLRTKSNFLQWSFIPKSWQ